MYLQERRSFLIFGVLFGAWLGFVYAFVSQAVNWLVLPGIPLYTPAGSLPAYLGQYMAMGGMLGLVSALPENRFVGAVVGGLTSAVLIGILAISDSWGLDVFGRTVIIVLLVFLPLAVLMMPVALLIRIGMDAQVQDPDRPYLWARRYLIPILLSLLVAAIGSFSLYSPNVRNAFRYTNQMVREGLQVNNFNALPEPLREVPRFYSEASGSYTLAWSDRVDTFFGPRPAGAEMSQFLIITHFDNGFTFACLFSSNRSVPICTNYR